jgi:hypothetical protein
MSAMPRPHALIFPAGRQAVPLLVWSARLSGG